MEPREEMLRQQFCEVSAPADLFTGRQNATTVAMASWPVLVIVDTISQVARCDGLVQLRNTNGSRNGKRMRHEIRGNGYDPLKIDSAMLAVIVLLGIVSGRGKIRIKIGITQGPAIGHLIK